MGRCPSFDMEMRRFTMVTMAMAHCCCCSIPAAVPARSDAFDTGFLRLWRHDETLQHESSRPRCRCTARRLDRRRRRTLTAARISYAPLLADGENKLFGEYEFLAHVFLDRIRTGTSGTLGRFSTRPLPRVTPRTSNPSTHRTATVMPVTAPTCCRSTTNHRHRSRRCSLIPMPAPGKPWKL